MFLTKSNTVEIFNRLFVSRDRDSIQHFFPSTRNRETEKAKRQTEVEVERERWMDELIEWQGYGRRMREREGKEMKG